MKTWKITAVVAGILLLAGCGSKPAVENNQIQDQKKSDGGIISSIADAIGSGKAMKCTYIINSGEGEKMTSVSYVKGEKYKSETEMRGDVQYVIFDGETMYSWNKNQRPGTKMEKSCTDELAKNAPQEDTSQTPDASGEKTFENAADVECVPAGNIDFSIPTDITFSDQCEMIKNLMKNVPSVPNMPGVPQM